MMKNREWKKEGEKMKWHEGMKKCGGEKGKIKTKKERT
jgi:hypothetical protein